MDRMIMKTAKITLEDATPDALEPLCLNFPTRKFQELARHLQKANNNECAFIIANYDQNPMGYCTVYWDSDFPIFKSKNIPEIVGLIVAENHRGHGIASKILKEIENRLIQKGYQKVGLMVLKSNKKARRLYKKFNYQKISHTEIPEINDTNLVLSKDLLR